MKIVCVLYDDPVYGYPPKYARDSIPVIESYPNGQTAPTPKAIDHNPGDLLGCVSGELGLRKFLEENGHTLVVTSDKDGDNSTFVKEVKDADVVISQPFFPAYLTREIMESAPNLKLAITAGIGSDHVDLQAAMDHNVTVAEVTFSNSISVSEHVVMMALALVRNYIPSYNWVIKRGWNIADCVDRAYDIEGMDIGVLGGAGRIGFSALRKFYGFDTKLHYFDKYTLPKDVESKYDLNYHSSVESLIKSVDILAVLCPLHPETENLVNKDLIYKMKRGSYIVNCARGKICNKQDIADALEEGQLAGYAGDVWFPQPAPNDHPWRTMPHHGMTPHTSGTTLSAQHRYASGTREILECFFDGRTIRDEYLIVHNGNLAGVGAKSYTKGSATSGSEEASKYKKI